MRNISNWFIRLAVLYLIAGVLLGIVMAASQNHTMHPVHAHLNLLGWVTMGLFASFYRLWPDAAESRLAKVHFWVYVPAHFVQMAALFALYRGVAAVEPLLGATSALVGLAIVLFAYIVWKYTGAAAMAGERASAVGGLAAR
jgi:cbb3-type cytochrome oxidase subunit 1